MSRRACLVLLVAAFGLVVGCKANGADGRCGQQVGRYQYHLDEDGSLAVFDTCTGALYLHATVEGKPRGVKVNPVEEAEGRDTPTPPTTPPTTPPPTQPKKR